jgi:hypothetical protein
MTDDKFNKDGIPICPLDLPNIHYRAIWPTMCCRCERKPALGMIPTALAAAAP